jgi:hypothetical protein
MDTTDRALVGTIGALGAALAVAVVGFTGKVRKLRQELQVCQDNALVLDNRLSACREELRSARMLE